MPTLLSKDQLSRANGLVQAARSATSLLAPIVGGFLVAVIGLGWILVIDLATFGIAVVTLLCLRFPSLKQSDGLEAKRKRHLLADIAAGLRYLRVRPGLLGLFIVSALAGLLGASADMLLAPYVLSFSSAQTLGWITAAVGAGFLMGDVVMSVWRGPTKRVRFFIACEIAVGLMGVLIGWSDSVLLIGLAAFLYFVFISISDATIQTVWQTKVAPNFHGRIFALRDMSAIGGIVLGLLIFAPVAEYLEQIDGMGSGRGLGLVFAASGALNMLVLLLGYAHPRVRRLEQELPDADETL